MDVVGHEYWRANSTCPTFCPAAAFPHIVFSSLTVTATSQYQQVWLGERGQPTRIRIKQLECCSS